MRAVSVLCACLIGLSACGGGGSGGNAPSEPAATATRAVATLAAPIPTTPPATATAAATAAPVATSAAPAATSAVPSAPATAAPTVAAATAPAATPAAPTIAATAPPPTPAATVAAAGGGTVVKVTLTETAIKVDRASAPAGTVTFAIVNAGLITHELIVLQTTIPQDKLPLSATNPKMVQTPGQVGEASNIAAGATATLTLTLASGAYDLICNIESHYKDGMHTGFTVTAAN